MAQMHPHLHIVILCEDYGSRLWPIAREQAPACLAPAAAGSKESLLEATVGRARPFAAPPLHVVTTEQLAPIIRTELTSAAGLAEDEFDLLVEPVEHGSAFSVALAVAKIRCDDPDAIVAVFPSNQKVAVDDRWANLVSRACAAAEHDYVVLVGGQQEEKCAENAYIRAGRPVEGESAVLDVRLFEVDAEPAGARRARKEGALWYTGVFFARAARIAGELLGAGSLAQAGGASNPARIAETAQFLSMLDARDWLNDDARKLIETLPRASYEQAALRHSRRLVVLPTTIPFSTVNSLEDLETAGPADGMYNRVLGAGYAVHSRNTTVYAQGAARRVITLGLRDAMVVDTPDALLVAQKEHLGDMDAVFAALGQAHGDELRAAVEAAAPEPAGDVRPAGAGVAAGAGAEAGAGAGAEAARPAGAGPERPAEDAGAGAPTARPATRTFGWGSAKLIAEEPGSALWRLRMLSGSRLSGLSVPPVYGHFGEGGAGAFREQYVVVDGEVEIFGAGDEDGGVSMAAGDAFEVDPSDPLFVRATQAATLILVAVQAADGAPAGSEGA